jgi:hypothetical protein
MAGTEQADERRIDGVSGPTVGRIGEMSADVFALLAGTDE